MKQIIYPTAFIICLIIVWEILARLKDASFILPTPTEVLVKIWSLRHVLLTKHLVATASIIVIGLTISLVLGVALATLMNESQWVERTLYPVLITSQTIPIIALAPIFVLWFGYSIWSKVLVTIVITFFPIAIASFDGFRGASEELRELMRAMGATRREIFLKLEVPSALPSFFSGLKVAIPMSVVGAAIGEWLGAQEGLGYFSRRMMTQFDGAGVFAPIVILSILGMVLFGLVRYMEKYMLGWRRKR